MLTAQEVLDKHGFIIIEGNIPREVGKVHLVYQGFGYIPDKTPVVIVGELTPDEAAPLLRSWGWSMATRKHIYKAVAE